MAKKTEKQSDDVYVLAEQLGIKKENLEVGLKQDKKKTEETIKRAAKFMGLI